MNPNMLPLLQTILQQQGEISKRLAALITILEKPREPIEPILRSILEPLDSKIGQVSRLVSQAPTEAAASPQPEAPASAPAAPAKSAATYLDD